MKYFIGALALIIFAGGLFLFWKGPSVVLVSAPTTSPSTPILEVPEAGGNQQNPLEKNGSLDIEPQKPLPNPPRGIKAVYLTSWSAGSRKKVDYIIDLIRGTELNAVVIDIKDYSGYVAYDTKVSEVEKYNAKEIRIPRLNALIKRLHDEGIYVIGRITIFQDPILALARPDLAIHSRAKLTTNNQQLTTETLWLDHKKLAWIDPAAKEAWDYNLAIAKDAAERGFDEINFDYIRFASDGNLSDMKFPFWQSTQTDTDGTRTHAETKSETINNFFKYVRESLPGVKISADLFGLATVQSDDLGIGQLIENAYAYFDYVSPMVYPSHYAPGFLNYKNPASHPYEVVKYSMESALKRLTDYGLQATATSTDLTPTEMETLKAKSYKLKAKLRPWLQDFNLGATYDAKMVKAQIQAVYDAARLPEPEVQAAGGQASSTPELLDGFMLWSPSNVYTKGALLNNE